MAFWSSNEHLGQGQGHERGEGRPAVLQGQSTATAMPYQSDFVGNGQKPWETSNGGLSHSFTGPFDAQSAVNSAANRTAYYANGGAFPVSASVPFPATSSFDINNTNYTTDSTISNASRPVTGQSFHASPSAPSSIGPPLAAPTFHGPLPSLRGHVGPSDIQQNMPPLGAVRPPAQNSAATASGSPKPATGQRKPLPSQPQQSNPPTTAPFKRALTYGTAAALALARPISAVARKNSRGVQRKNDLLLDVSASRPASALASDSKHNDGNGGTGVKKPVMKMKRTGQNFPLSSVGASSPMPMSAALHQRISSYSPSARSTPGLPSPSTRKPPDSVLDKASGSSVPGDKGTMLEAKAHNPDVDPEPPSNGEICQFCVVSMGC